MSDKNNKAHEACQNNNQDTSKTLRELTIKQTEPILFKFEDIQIDSFKLLRLLMFVKHLSYSDVGSKLGLSKGYVWDILHGKKNPPYKTKKKIAEFFSLLVEFLWRF